MAMIECVPNFSEGRRPEVIESILKAISDASAAKIIDSRSDPDHNRTVVTMVGGPDEVFDAAFAGIKKAAELIDMDQHRGEHPRIGATDVVPFVPVSDITLAECVDLARRLAERVSRELGIPTYLYEAAATRPDRVDLAKVRKGQYEGLKDAIRTDPDRAPDFGPSRLPQAGATVIGAREFLVAYNIYLQTTEVEIAKDIAKHIREKDGGFPYVKAMGFETKPFVQVSINLTNFKQTPMHVVFDEVRNQAMARGVAVVSSEIYGMVPLDPLLAAAEHHLQLGNDWQRTQVIERRLEVLEKEQALLRAMKLEGFLKELSSGSPTPGGGSAACLSGAMGAALGGMVSRLTVGKKGYEEVQQLFATKVKVFDELRTKLTEAIDADARAFDRVIEALRLPKETDEQKKDRSERIQEGYKAAAKVPLETAELCRRVIAELVEISESCNKNSASDAAVGLQCAYSGMRGAIINVETNLSAIKDDSYKVGARARLEALNQGVEEKVESTIARIRSVL